MNKLKELKANKSLNPSGVTFPLAQKWKMNVRFLELIFKSYIRNFSFVFFGFFQPILLFVIFYFLFTALVKPNNSPPQVISGYLLLAPVSTSLFAMSAMLSTWKDSILLKRLDVTPISKLRMFILLITFFFLISLLSSAWTMLWAVIMVAARTVKTGGIEWTVAKTFQNVNWGWLIIAIAEIILVANCIAIFAAGVVRGVNRTEAIVSSFYFPSAFLGGVIFPNALIDSYSGLKWVSYFSLFKFPALISNYAWDPQTMKTTQEFFYNNPWSLILLTLFWPALFIGLALRTFKWS